MVAITAVLVLFNWFPDPTTLPEPRLLFLNGKSFLTPMRLLQFLALAAVFSAAYPLIARLRRGCRNFCLFWGAIPFMCFVWDRC